jgi:hypothetical protein
MFYVYHESRSLRRSLEDYINISMWVCKFFIGALDFLHLFKNPHQKHGTRTMKLLDWRLLLYAVLSHLR